MPNHFISLSDAQSMIARFKKLKNTILLDACLGKDILPTCETFDREAFDTLLSKDGCEKIRAYLGMDEEDRISLIFVAVNGDDEDLINTDSAEDGEDGDIFENGYRCPTFCPPDSPING